VRGLLAAVTGEWPDATIEPSNNRFWGGTAFAWTDGEGNPVAGTTAWSIGSAQGDHFAPSTATFMVNYRVEDLHVLVEALREEGCYVLEKIDESEYGKFARVIDPEGNKLELWQPPAGRCQRPWAP
jgi:predicted enzyme related to lactoylglutathione lyase